MEDHERPDFERLLKLLTHVDGWLTRLDPAEAGGRPLAEGCPLREDDRRADPFHTSHAVWGALSHAVDHLHMLQAALRDARIINMYAPFSLIRGALENASAAVWLLAPASRMERLARRFRFAAADIKNGEKAKELVGHIGPRTLEERLARLREVARAAGVAEAEAVRRVSYEEIVKAVGGETPTREKGTLFVWRMCSGIAHGDFWTTAAIAERVEIPGAPEGIAYLKVEASMTALLYGTLAAVDMTARGWQLLDVRSQSPYG